MAENKQYVTMIQDNGTVQISEDVLTTIVDHAAQEVEGVVNISSKPVADIAELIGKKNWGKGIKINIGEDESVSVDCSIHVAYGQSVVNVASAVQTAITGAIESTVGIQVTSVNVNVCGIVRV